MIESPTIDNNLTGNGVFCTLQELFHESLKSKHAHLRLNKKASEIRTGIKRSAMRGRGMEFLESRPYVFADEMRNIDWKVSARLGGLFTKIFTEEKYCPILFAIDFRKSMFFGSRNCFKSVLSARLVAQIAAAAINGNDQIGGVIFDGHQEKQCSLGGGRKNLARLLGMLADASQNFGVKPVEDDESLWPLVLKRLAIKTTVRSQIFLISDFLDLDENARAQLLNLKKKANVIALTIRDPLEESLPAIGYVGMAYGERRIVFDSSNKQLQRNYNKWWIEQKNLVQSVFSSVNIPTIEFCTALDPARTLNQIFSGRWRM